MREVQAKVHVPAPPDVVFGFVSDPENLPAWQTGIAEARTTSAGPIGVGSTAHVVRELMGQRLAVDVRVTAYEPGRRLVLESGASGIGIVGTLNLAPRDADAGTDLTFAMAIRAESPWMRPMEGMVAGAAERDLADSLERVRRHFAG